MKFLATADWQLGMTAHFLPAEARDRYRQARIDAIRRIGEIAAAEGAQFVVVAGDVFESNQLDRTVVARALTAMGEMPVPVWLLPGNHDPLDAGSIYLSEEFERQRPGNVHVFTEPGLLEVADGVDVVAAPWFSKAPLSDLVNDAIAGVDPDATRVRIVVGHGADWTADSGDLKSVKVADVEAAAAAGRIDFCVLGDHHSRRQVAAHTWYPGTPEVTRHREQDPGHVLVVELGDGDPVVTTHDVGQWAFDVVEAELSSRADVDDLDARLTALPHPERRAVKLRLTGTLSLQDKARLDLRLEHHGNLFGSIEHWDRHTDVAVLPADGEVGDLGLTGWAKDAVDELAEAGRTEGAGGQAARDALGLLYRLSGGAA
ncbi:metallophosphoesterase family protein [Aeromicrobium marinum]|uniref:metallophosphoesterase family protein n=1 Tax=Aeromicrobium marinum TaxID=219314 RepID=UPI00058F1E8C|nr:metallophosphoesterase [Aeromicrobium marinum]